METNFQPIVHYFLHFGFPLILAIVFFRKEWKKAYLIMLLTMFVDLDHLLSSPVFDANRCSIGFHVLHSYYAMIIYFLMLFFKGTVRIIGLGLLFHMFTDLIDCVLTFSNCVECLAHSSAKGLVEAISDLFFK